MSVSRMKKLTVFVHRSDTEDLIHRLVRLRCVDVAQAPVTDGRLAVERSNCDEQRTALEKSVSDLGEAITVLSRYSKRTRSLLHPKLQVDTDRYVADGYAEQARFTVKETLASVARRDAIKNEIAGAQERIMAATPYRNYDLPLGFDGTATTRLFLGAFPGGADLPTLRRELYAAGAVTEPISESTSGKFTAVICHRDDVPQVESLLSSSGFLAADFHDVSETAASYITRAEKETRRLVEEDEALEAKLSALADSLGNVEILSDVEKTRLEEVIQRQKTVTTESTVMLCGWVPERMEDRVENLLGKYSCAYELSEPEEEDNPPILLENNAFARNFEWVLGMYSYPAYGKFDPTFVMSIFYFIIFGIMFADAGYGLVLTVACFAAVKILKPGERMERFLKMFGYCGISCMIFGVLFGAYFGDFPLAIMRNMMGMSEEELPNLALLGSDAANVAVLFDPLQNPMAFLVVSLGIGAIHLISGMAVKFVLLCREGKVWDAIFDIGAYWVLFAGLGLLALVPAVGKWVAIAGVVLIVLTHGRAEKNIVMKFVKGLLGLYDLISYASDLLSYSRILALGLAAGIIAQVVNILGTMGGATVPGIIGLVVVFLLGHVLNIGINVLGTFVHTSRLQYIEFFNKFYEDGGVEFDPALPSEQYTVETPDQIQK